MNNNGKTKYNFADSNDRHFCEEAFNNHARLLFGNDEQQIEKFRKLFDEKVQSVTTVPYGTNGRYVNSKALGVCAGLDTGKYELEMWGFKNAQSDEKKNKILHTLSHEYCHVFSSLAPMMFSRYPNGKALTEKSAFADFGMNGEVTETFVHHGIIYERGADGKYIGSYGKMINETMMDMLTYAGLVSFQGGYAKTKNKGDASVNDVFTQPYESFGGSAAQTGYSEFNSITRLLLAGFSNYADADYQDLVDKGKSIFTSETVMTDKDKNKIRLKTNDFLYGVMCDPYHIQTVYDTYAEKGEGSYRKMAKRLDGMFDSYLNGTYKINPENVKYIMTEIPNVLNKRNADQFNRGLIDKAEISKRTRNFNKIWNQMQSDYRTYFNQSEINKITETGRGFYDIKPEQEK